MQNIFANVCGCCGNCCPCFFGGKKEVRILMIGLDGAGKTTILYRLKMGETVKTEPTLGFITEEIDYKVLKFSIWDISGKNEIRGMWSIYYPNTDGLIFVVDSSDKSRIAEAAKELKKVLDEGEELKDCPILVMANKQDLNGAMNPNEVTEKLQLKDLKERQWNVQGTSALTGQGLKEGLDWMASVLLKKK